MTEEEDRWTSLELVDDHYYDGPLVQVKVGKYFDESEPRLAIILYDFKRGEIVQEMRVEIKDVENWLERLKAHK